MPDYDSPDSEDDPRVVFESMNRVSCQDRALVLTAAGIPHRMILDGNTAIIVVPAAESARAVAELRAYDEENPPRPAQPKPRIPDYGGRFGVAVYVIVVCVVALLDTSSAFGFDWRSAGRIDGELIRSGEWWRAATALTLHSDLPHLAGNLVFGGVFGWFAGRLLGSGFAWSATLVAAIAANLVNTLLLDSAHRSIGASTAVFAVLGLTSGYVFRAKLMAQDQWFYRWGPVVGGLAMLRMYTGTGDENTDIGAHLLGFCCGFVAGALMVRAATVADRNPLQFATGILAVLLIVAAWAIALRG